jgi:hypothetical protein
MPPPLPPPASTELDMVPDTPPRRAPAATHPPLFSRVRPDEEEEEEQEIDEAFIPPPSTAPAALSRAGRKRAPTMKALEAEKAPKRGTGQGRGGRGSRGGRQAKK